MTAARAEQGIGGPGPFGRIAERAGRLSAKPLVWMYRSGRPLIGEDQAFRALTETLALIPGPAGIIVRRAVYEQVLRRVGRDLSVGFGTIIAHPSAELGDDVYIGRYCLIGNARIGDGCLVADYVRVVTGVHGTDPQEKIRDQPTTYHSIQVGTDCWLANGAIILADVGDHAIVGAGSVVTRAVAEGLVVVGNPARTLRSRTA